MAKRKAATAKRKDPDAEGAVGSGGDAVAVAVVDESPEAKAAKIERGPSKSPSAAAAPTDDDVASLSRLAVAALSALPRRRRPDDNDDDDDDDRRGNRRFLSECDSSGAVERTLWPCFLRRASVSAVAAATAGGGGGEGGHSDDGDDDDDNGEDKGMGREAAFALALLSNRRGGGVEGGAPMGETKERTTMTTKTSRRARGRRRSRSS